MATLSQRIIAASGAIVFFLTSIALSVVVIITIMQEDGEKQTTSNSQTAESGDGKLAGTKLEGFSPVAEVPELKTEELQTGSGKEITSVNDTITVDYTGALAADGTIFESSKDGGQPLTTQLSGLIEGWQKGLIGMKEGGKRRLLIPSEQAYGPREQGNIPANSDLVFDITLQKVGQ